MAPAHKRKRDDEGNEGEPAYGLRQTLPVANLPADFVGEPMDGLQYLFTVRRDARKLPAITRVQNPYEVTLPETIPSSESKSFPVPKKIRLPSEEWREIFIRRFVNFRKNVKQPTIHVHLPIPRTRGQRLMPDKKERDAWWEFLAGSPSSVWDPPHVTKQAKPKGGGQAGPVSVQGASRPRRMLAYENNMDEWVVGTTEKDQLTNMHDAEMRVSDTDSREGVLASGSFQGAVTGDAAKVNGSDSVQTPQEPSPTLVPREPTPNLLQYIDHRMSLHLLMYFTHWFNLHLESLDPSSTAPVHVPLESHARWIFVLLGRVDDFCSGDEISGLRALARGKKAAGRSEMGEVSCWMVICAVAGVWGQRDLWSEAEEMLSKCRFLNAPVRLSCIDVRNNIYERQLGLEGYPTVKLEDRSILPTDEVLKAFVDGTTGNQTVSAPSGGFPVGQGFRVNIVQDTTHTSTIYAQSSEFAITQSNSSVSSASSTASSSSSGTFSGSSSAISTASSAVSSNTVANLNPTSSQTGTSPSSSNAATRSSFGSQGVLAAVLVIGYFFA
ncbi:hypothetical protein EW146_g4209 [Bondarzewia mesenterica]|uniref:Uncharacterized protein n=1 Tax=Bondarzewia mesenterica TaxID=1095465 RepID=A0A4V3XF74_9AGAM|nr:hypothetical protein EW146_g4209 [Bondarzewia mesenterica]